MLYTVVSLAVSCESWIDRTSLRLYSSGLVFIENANTIGGQ